MNIQGKSSADFQNSFCVALSSLVLCPVDSNCLVLPRLSAPSLQLREHASLLLGLLPTAVLHCSRETYQAESWSHHRAHLSCFLSIKAHFSSLPDVQCLKKCYFIYFFWFLVVTGGRVNLAHVTPSLADTEIHSRFVKSLPVGKFSWSTLHSAFKQTSIAEPKELVTACLYSFFGWGALDLLFWIQNHLYPGDCHWFLLFYSQQTQAFVPYSCQASLAAPSPTF